MVGEGGRGAGSDPSRAAVTPMPRERSFEEPMVVDSGRQGTPVMALVWKELWECGPWLIVAGLVVLGLGTMEVLWLARMPAERWLQAPRTSHHGFQKSCLSTVGVQLLTASLALGPVLAIRQFLVPSITGEWGFSLHRSASRARLLAVKVATAALGVAVVLGGAWTIVFWHAGRPGVIWLPPPLGQLAEGWHHVAWGIAAYLGTALSCMSTARWHETRLSGALFVAAGAWCVFSGGFQLGAAAVVCGLCASVLLVVLAHTFLRREF